MQMRNPLLVMVLGVLASCTTAREPDRPVAVVDAQSLITRVLLDYTPAATRQTGDDARFQGAALQKSIAAVLAGRGLADITRPAVVRVAAIEVDEFDVRATSNVVLMGRVASAGVLGATVSIRDGSGAALRQFHVRADLPVSISRNGKEAIPLESLYRGFANLIADELMGTAGRSPAQNR